MSDELNLEADIARVREVLDYCGTADKEAFERELENLRRTAPVSATLDAQALPPLPSAFMDLFSPTARKAWEGQMHEYARTHAAPYAARIAHLEREYAELREASLAMSAELSKFQGAAYLAKIDGRTAGTAPDETMHVESEAVSAMLWLYRRLPRCYGRPPNVEKPIADLAKLAGFEMNFIADSFAERVAAPSPQSKQEEAK